jgi:ribulose-phosphate 3-epimerase
MSRPILVSASLLASDFSSLTSTLNTLENIVDMIHFDVMDGSFVPNITFGSKFIADLRPKSNKIFDVHLMINNPKSHIPAFIQAGADIITIHYESSDNLLEILTLIKKAKKKAGLAINPSTSLNSIIHLLPEIDLLLIMTVNPGFCNQKFLPDQLAKIIEAKQALITTNINCILQVDGGVNETNALQLAKAGVDCLVSGSFIFNNNGPNISRIMHLKQLVS